MIGEFVKSLGSFTLGMSMLGLQVVWDTAKPSPRGEHKGPATKTLDTITDVTTQQFGPTLRAGFRVLDNVQRGMTALAFDLVWSVPRNTYRSGPLSVTPAVRARRRA